MVVSLVSPDAEREVSISTNQAGMHLLVDLAEKVNDLGGDVQMQIAQVSGNDAKIWLVESPFTSLPDEHAYSSVGDRELTDTEIFDSQDLY